MFFGKIICGLRRIVGLKKTFYKARSLGKQKFGKTIFKNLVDLHIFAILVCKTKNMNMQKTNLEEKKLKKKFRHQKFIQYFILKLNVRQENNVGNKQLYSFFNFFYIRNTVFDQKSPVHNV